MLSKHLTFLALAFALTLCPVAQSRALEIEVRKNPKVTSTLIRVSDLVRVVEGTKIQQKTLSHVYVGKAPAPGSIKVIKRKDVERQLKAAGISPAHLSWLGGAPESFTVEHAVMMDQGYRLETFVQALVKERLPVEIKEVEVVIPTTYKGADHLPKEKLTFRLLPRQTQNWVGKMHLSLEVYVNGKPHSVLRRVPVTVKAYIQAVITTRALYHKNKIKGHQLKLSRVLYQEDRSYVFSVEEAMGRIFTGNYLADNTALTREDLQTPELKEPEKSVWAMPFEDVEVVESGDGFRITHFWRALAQGHEGDVIEVDDKQGRRFRVKLTGPQKGELTEAPLTVKTGRVPYRKQRKAIR